MEHATVETYVVEFEKEMDNPYNATTKQASNFQEVVTVHYNLEIFNATSIEHDYHADVCALQYVDSKVSCKDTKSSNVVNSFITSQETVTAYEEYEATPYAITKSHLTVTIAKITFDMTLNAKLKSGETLLFTGKRYQEIVADQ